MKLIYIAGPYTAPTGALVQANIQKAREVADRVNRIVGCFAVTPHFLGSTIEDSLSPSGWYEGTLEVMRRCDAVVLVNGWEASKGAGDERYEAMRRGMPCFSEAELAEVGPRSLTAFAAPPKESMRRGVNQRGHMLTELLWSLLIFCALLYAAAAMNCGGSQ